MADYTITLTSDQVDAFITMLSTTAEGLEAALEAHLVKIANAHIEKELDAEFEAKTLAEKQTLLS